MKFYILTFFIVLIFNNSYSQTKNKEYKSDALNELLKIENGNSKLIVFESIENSERKLIYKPKNFDECELKSKTVVVTVLVNQQGKVSMAKIVREKTDTEDNCLLNISISLSFKFIWNESESKYEDLRTLIFQY